MSVLQVFGHKPKLLQIILWGTNVFTKFNASPCYTCRDIHTKTSRKISKVGKIHHLVTRNVCTKLHNNNSSLDQSGRPTNCQSVLRSLLLAWLKSAYVLNQTVLSKITTPSALILRC